MFQDSIISAQKGNINTKEERMSDMCIQKRSHLGRLALRPRSGFSFTGWAALMKTWVTKADV